MFNRWIITGVVTVIMVIIGSGLYYKLSIRLVTTSDINFLYPGFKQKAFVISFDDGLPDDSIALQILDSLNIQGTFYLTLDYLKQYYSTDVSDTNFIQKFLNRYTNHQIGSHCYFHDRLTNQIDSLIRFNLNENKRILDMFSHSSAQTLAYPYGDYNAKIIEIAKQTGYLNARTINNNGKFELPNDWMQWNTTCMLEELESVVPRFKKANPSRWGICKKLFYRNNPQNCKNLMCLNTWGHSHIFNLKEQRSLFIEQLSALKADSGIWFTTNMELHKYVSAIKQSIVTKFEIYNTSNDVLNFELKGKMYTIPAKGIINISQIKH